MDKLRALLYGSLLLLIFGWVLHVGKAILVPAVPITAIMTIVFSEFPGTRPVAVLLSKNGRL